MPDVPSLGRRGGGWVVLQFVLFAAAAAACAAGPRWPEGARAALVVAGVLASLAGAAVVVASARELGSALTPFPKPRPHGRLVETGPFRVVRHPIYAGGLVFLAGLSLVLSPLAFAPTAALAVLWALKARVEERFLREAFPGYAAYAERTRWRLVPYVH